MKKNNPKILIIDDEELITRTFTNFLKKRGMDVFIAKNNEEALAITRESDMDVIISDIRMPGYNGIETIHQIGQLLESQRRQRPPVIFITGYSDKTLEEEARQLGCAEFFYKPFENKNMLEAIDKCVSMNKGR